MTLGRPLLLWLLLLGPSAGLAIAWLWRRRLQRESRWAGSGLWESLGRRHRTGFRRLVTALVALTVAATALALARPRWGGESELVERRGIDLVFVLDTSWSMAAQDVAPSRLDVASALIRRIAEQIPGSRVALVQAEGDGVVLTPLTLDVAVLDLLLETTAPGTAPTPGTRLGGALDQAMTLLPPSSRGHGAVVLLTDGEDHGGGLDRAAESLQNAGVPLLALGIGTLQGAPIPTDDGSGFKRGPEGTVVISHLEEATLERLTRASGGLYIRADSAIVDLSDLFDALRQIRTRPLDDRITTSTAERFQWPLGAAVALLAIALALRIDVPAGSPR